MQKQPGLEIGRLVSHAYDKEGIRIRQPASTKFPHDDLVFHIYCSLRQNSRYFLLRVFAKLKKGWPVTLTYLERSNPKNVLLLDFIFIYLHLLFLIYSKIIPKISSRILSLILSTMPFQINVLLIDFIFTSSSLTKFHTSVSSFVREGIKKGLLMVHP